MDRDFQELYLTKLLGFSEELEGINLNFKDEELENNYRESDISYQMNKSKIFCILIVSFYVFLLANGVYQNRMLVRNSYILIGMLIVDVILFRISTKCSNRYQVSKLLKHLRFLLFYFTLMSMFFFQNNITSPLNNYRYTYCLLLFINFLYLFMLDFNIIMLIFVPILNTGTIWLAMILGLYDTINIYPDILVLLAYYFLTIIIKKQDFSNKKLGYFESFKNRSFINYTKNLIDGLNNMIITMKKKEVIFLNNYTINFLERNGYSKSNFALDDEIKEKESTEILKSEKENHHNHKINICVNSFFKSLVLSTPLDKTLAIGTPFSKILIDIFDKTNNDSNNFTKIGYFTCGNEGNILYFDVNVRKLRFKEEIVEVLIYDITEIKQAEKVNIESNFKQKILSKIAHEFKTPLIIIITLVNKMVENYSEKSESIKKNLYHVCNLSYYVLSLISDMISYVSNCVGLRTNLKQTDIHEVVDTCFRILKTLIECNEVKSNKVKAILEFDENIKTLKIFTDEEILKQIIINFISNAYKFTLSGFIKIKAKIKKNLKSIQIYVKDTGMGIKEEEKNLIFRENIQINLDQEYNDMGSCFGMSISKNLAKNLGSDVGFKSSYGVGSKFFIDLSLDNKANYTKKSFILDHFVDNSADRSLEILISRNKKLSPEMREDDIITKRASYQLIKYEMPENTVSIERSLNLEATNYEIDLQISFCICAKDNERDIIVVIDDQKMVRENLINLIKNLVKGSESNRYHIVE